MYVYIYIYIYIYIYAIIRQINIYIYNFYYYYYYFLNITAWIDQQSLSHTSELASIGVFQTIILTCVFPLHPYPHPLCMRWQPLSGTSPMAELNANLFMGLHYYRLEFLSNPKFGSHTLTYLLYPNSKGIFPLKISISRAENALVIH